MDRPRTCRESPGHGVRFGQQEFLDAAAEHGTEDVQLIELDHGGVA
jgi:hypothetical protein